MRLVAPENSVALRSADVDVPINILPEGIFIYATGEAVNTSRISRCGRVFLVYDACVVAHLDESAVEVVNEAHGPF